VNLKSIRDLVKRMKNKNRFVPQEKFKKMAKGNKLVPREECGSE